MKTFLKITGIAVAVCCFIAVTVIGIAAQRYYDLTSNECAPVVFTALLLDMGLIFLVVFTAKSMINHKSDHKG